jgi:LAO/AO transport system kinase
MSEKLIEKELSERAVEGRITCTEARKIAERLQVPYILVGRAANRKKIKIVQCELGCF